MTVSHLIFLVEESSMEAFLRSVLERMLPHTPTFEVIVFRGKQDLLGKLRERLRGYQRWLPADWRLVVLVDQDSDDCRELKSRLEQAVSDAGMSSRAQGASGSWQVVTRIAIEELEAWYFGDWEAVREVYPRVKSTVPKQSRYRDPDAIRGGTWEAFERILQRSGYFRTGLRKVEAAQTIAACIDPQRNRSRSFSRLCDVVAEVSK